MFRSPFKVQKHKRFDFSPRFYDQRKENIHQTRKYFQNSTDGEFDHLDFSGTFHAMRKKNRGLSDKLPLLTLIGLAVCSLAYVQSGNEIYLYLACALFPSYILLRLKQSQTTKKPTFLYKKRMIREEKEITE